MYAIFGANTVSLKFLRLNEIYLSSFPGRTNHNVIEIQLE